ncbi:carbohydrate ABC transporter permease [Nocardia sp. NPDC004722]
MAVGITAVAVRRDVGERQASGRPGPLERRQRRLFWPFVLPASLFYLVLFLAPIAYSAYTSFYKWDGMGAMQWRGFDNYRMLWDDPAFRTALTNTLKILVVGGAVIFMISFALTLVLREMKARMFARSVLFFPCLINALVYGAAAGFLFNPNGPVNTVLGWVGVSDPPKWLATGNTFTLIVAVLVWSATGYYTTILMAAVDDIPPYLYEAAELDGAGAFQRFWHVTLPLSWEVISVCAVLWTVSSLKIFELVLMFGGADPNNPPVQTWTTSIYVYNAGFPPSSVPKLGLASAAAIVSLLMVGVFTLILRRAMRRDPIQY